MPFVETCTFCSKAIDADADQYTAVNKGAAKTPAEYIYAHVACLQRRKAERAAIQSHATSRTIR